MKLAKSVNFAGRLYMPGENIKGEIPPEMIALLAENGAILPHDEEKMEDSNQLEQEQLGETEADRALTMEEFGKLKADEQKALLESLSIEAATKEEKRIEQYSDWLASEVRPDES